MTTQTKYDEVLKMALEGASNYIVLAQQSNEQVEPDWSDEQLKMLNFLYGAGDFDGVWFEQKHPTERGAFWWRKHLKRLFSHPPVPYVVEPRTAQPKEPEQRSNEHLEPVAVVRNVTKAGQEGVKVTWIGGFPQIGMKLYTTPPYVPTERQRPSRSDIKPLTDERITELWAQYNPLHGIGSFVRQVEAAHGIRPTDFKE